MPRGEQQRKERKCERGENRGCPHVVAHGGGTAAECHRDDPCTNEKNGGLGEASHEKREHESGAGERLHGQLSFRPLEMRRARRSNSSCFILAPSPPRSAATTFSAEPSKNVST